MAKYVRTKLIFEGESEGLKKIVEELKGDDVIDFNKIIPLNDENEIVEKWGIEDKPEELDMILYRNETLLEYSFDTLKKAPMPILEKAAEMYPECHIVVKYAYEDYGNNCAMYESLKDSKELVEKQLDDPFVFACDVWEVDPDEAMIEEAINYYEE